MSSISGANFGGVGFLPGDGWARGLKLEWVDVHTVNIKPGVAYGAQGERPMTINSVAKNTNGVYGKAYKRPNMTLDPTIIEVEVTTDIVVDIEAAVGPGGLDSGTEAVSTLYDVYLICHADGGLPNGLLVVSGTAPTVPTGYSSDMLFWLGTACNDSAGDFVAQMDPAPSKMSDRGRKVIYLNGLGSGASTETQVVSAGAATSSTAIDLSVQVPEYADTVLLYLEGTSTGGPIDVRLLSGVVQGAGLLGVSTTTPGCAIIEVPVNGLPATEINYAWSAALGLLDVWVYGYTYQINTHANII